MQTLIIDGYNVIYAVPEIEELLGESLEAARIRLIRFLLEAKNSRKDIERVCVVFDGKAEGYDEETSAAPGITAIYTQKGKDADKKILEIIKNSADPGIITVVSNDNFIFNNSRVHGARMKTVSEFLKMIKR